MKDIVSFKMNILNKCLFLVSSKKNNDNLPIINKCRKLAKNCMEIDMTG